MPFQRALLKLRKESGLTQEELARKAGLSRGAIAKLESDEAREPSWGTIIRLADALMVPLDSFVDAARRSVDPPIDRLESLEARVSDLLARTTGLEDRQLALARLLDVTRDDVRQIHTLLPTASTRRRPS